MPTLLNYRCLAQRHLRSTADTLFYQVPTGVSYSLIKTVVFCNTTGSACAASLWLNQVGTASGDDYAIVKSMSVAANTSDQRIYSDDSALVLKGNAGAVIVKAGTAAAMTVSIFGIEVTET